MYPNVGCKQTPASSPHIITSVGDFVFSFFLMSYETSFAFQGLHEDTGVVVVGELVSVYVTSVVLDVLVRVLCVYPINIDTLNYHPNVVCCNLSPEVEPEQQRVNLSGYRLSVLKVDQVYVLQLTPSVHTY
jgi:hypothetical protein